MMFVCCKCKQIQKSEHIWQFPPIRVRRLLQSLMDFVLETKASFWDISLVSLENVIFAGDFDVVKQGFIYSTYLITCKDNLGRHLVRNDFAKRYNRKFSFNISISSIFKLKISKLFSRGAHNFGD